MLAATPASQSDGSEQSCSMVMPGWYSKWGTSFRLAKYLPHLRPMDSPRAPSLSHSATPMPDPAILTSKALPITCQDMQPLALVTMFPGAVRPWL